MENRIQHSQHLGHFDYFVMPFGGTNAPVIFQALIKDALQDMLNRFLFVYIDEILMARGCLRKRRGLSSMLISYSSLFLCPGGATISRPSEGARSGPLLALKTAPAVHRLHKFLTLLN